MYRCLLGRDVVYNTGEGGVQPRVENDGIHEETSSGNFRHHGSRESEPTRYERERLVKCVGMLANDEATGGNGCCKGLHREGEEEGDPFSAAGPQIFVGEDRGHAPPSD